MSCIQLEYLSGIVRNLSIDVSLSSFIHPTDFQVGMTVISPDQFTGFKLILSCDEAWFHLFRKYGFIKSMDLISFQDETFDICATHTLQLTLHDAVSFVCITDPLHIIGLNHPGFQVSEGTDNTLNDYSIDKVTLINEYLDFQPEDNVDYKEYFTRNNHRNKTLWKHCHQLAINIEIDPNYDYKTYIKKYKMQRKRMMPPRRIINQY
eukprot:199910_1